MSSCTNYQQTINKQTVKAKAVAEISKMENLQDTFVVVMHGWQSEPTDGSKGGWGSDFSLSFSLSLSLACLCLSLPVYLSVCLSICLSFFLSICLAVYVYLSVCLSFYLSVYLSICLSVYLSACLSVNLSIGLSFCLSIFLPVYRSICLSFCLSICLSVCLSVYLPNLSICLSVYLSISLSIYRSKTKQFCEASSTKGRSQLQNDEILRDFPNFQSYQQQRSNSARLPSKMECWVRSWRPRTNAFCDASTPSV